MLQACSARVLLLNPLGLLLPLPLATGLQALLSAGHGSQGLHKGCFWASADWPGCCRHTDSLPMAGQATFPVNPPGLGLAASSLFVLQACPACRKAHRLSPPLEETQPTSSAGQPVCCRHEVVTYGSACSIPLNPPGLWSAASSLFVLQACSACQQAHRLSPLLQEAQPTSAHWPVCCRHMNKPPVAVLAGSPMNTPGYWLTAPSSLVVQACLA